MSLKEEMEMAMRLLEKDIHEKQDTVISLRKQLEDIKTINIDLYNRLQVRKLVGNEIARKRSPIYHLLSLRYPLLKHRTHPASSYQAISEPSW